MLQVRKVHFYEDSYEVVETFPDNQMGICFDFATTLHAATMNLCEDEDMNKKHSGPYAVHITNEDGESMWEQCSIACRPQTTGILQ